MSKIMILCLLFACGSILGWVLELFFRRFATSHRWINTGFLVGPYLPLYGFGVAILFILSYYIRLDLLFDISKTANTILVIIIMSVTMTIIEYIAGIIFIKGMGIKLWDYSDRWGNFQGIICPLFSFLWTIVVIMFYFFIRPICIKLIDWFSVNAYDNIWLPFLLGAFYGVLFVDICYSFNITSKIRTFAKENKVIIKLESFKELIRDFHKKTKTKFSFLFPLKSKLDVKEHLNNYKQKIKEKFSTFDGKNTNRNNK